MNTSDNISIASFAVHGLLAEGKLNIFTYLEACRYRYDLRTADIWNGLIPDIADDGLLKKIREEMDARDLVCVNYHVDGVHVWEDDADKREHNRKNALVHLRAAHVLGAKTVRIDTGGTLTAMNSEQRDTMVNTFAEYCKFGRDHGFRVGPETHWGFSLLSDNMVAMAEGVNSPAYGVLLHIGHWEDGDPDGGDAKMAKYAMHTHVDATTSVTNIGEKIAMLLGAGYGGCWGVEHHTGKNEYHEIAVQLAHVRRALAKMTAERRHAHTTAVAAVPIVAATNSNPLLTEEQENQHNPRFLQK